MIKVAKNKRYVKYGEQKIVVERCVGFIRVSNGERVTDYKWYTKSQALKEFKESLVSNS